MSSRLAIIVTTALMILGIAGGSIGAAPKQREETRPVDVNELLNTSAKNTPSAVAATRGHYDRLRKHASDDSRLDYAYGVALLNQKRYKDALPFVTRYVATQPSERYPQWTLIWALVQNRQYTESLAAAAKLADSFPQPAIGTPSDELREMAINLGQLFGYLERAKANAIDPALKSQRVNEVLARLGDQYLDAFNEGRQIVVEKFNQLDAERLAVQEERVQRTEMQKQKVKDDLDDKQVLAEASKAAIDSTESGLQDASRELSLIQHQISGLQNDRLRASAQIANAQAQLYQIVQGVDTFTINRGPVNQHQIYSEIWAIDPARRMLAEPWLRSLASLNRQTLDISRRLVALQTRAVQLGGKAQLHSAALDESEKQLRAAERRARMLEKQARKLDNQKPESSPALPAKMTALSTYIPFPFDDEKARILGWFAK